MRSRSLTQNSQKQTGFVSPGGTVTGSLILNPDTSKPNYAVTKQYVDTVFSTLTPQNFTHGTIPVERLPPFAGDLRVDAGKNIITLQGTSISPGVFSKVTVNSKGLIVNGFGLIPADIPSLSFTKITTGKPTTFLGYGIVDALNKNGGVLTGNLTLLNDPQSDAHVTTLRYARNQVAQRAALRTGDIVLKPSTFNSSQFLKCNGQSVDKQIYADLFTLIQDTFANGTIAVDTFKVPDLANVALVHMSYFIKT